MSKKITAEMKVAPEKKHPELNVTERTVRNELSRLGYAAILPKRVPLFTPKAKEIRLKWTCDYQHYDWHNVVFSDKPIMPMVKHPLKVHVCGCMVKHPGCLLLQKI